MPLTTTASNDLTLSQVSTLTGLSGAEISAFDPASDRLFTTSANGLQIINFANVAAPSLISTVNFVSLGAVSNDVQSVATKNGIVAVALRNLNKTEPGEVVFLNATDGSFISKVTVGANPDMVTFTPDGTKVLVANEAELRTTTDVAGVISSSSDGVVDTNIDAPGSVSIINIAGGAASPTVTTAGFTSFDGQEAALRTAGVRITAGNSASADFEPEYIAVSPDGTKALVTLQENNAVAVLDIATGTFTSVVPLGLKDFSTLLSDFSDRDNAAGTGQAIKLELGNPVFGAYMPDAIASFTSGGQTFYVIANEGDDRNDFLATAETAAVSTLTLDATKFPTRDTLNDNNELGRLGVLKADGDTDGDGDIDQLVSLGGRSFSILDATGKMVFDSGTVTEQIAAATGLFNAATGGTGAYDDGRSDNKGMEPEGITVGTIGSRTYAFLALERGGGGVMAFDITNPDAVTYTTYANNIDAPPLDVGAEGILFVKAADSPTGQDLVIVSNETSNTVTTYAVATEVDYTLQILHYYGESGLLGVDTAPIMGAMIDKFDDQYANTLVLAEGDSWIPGPWLIAGADPSLNAVPGIGATALARPDVAIMNAFGTDASALGNHEFDLGSPIVSGAIAPSGAWVGAQFPFITANLDFSADASLRGRADASLGGTATNLYAGQEVSAIKGRIAPYAVSTQNGEKIGIIGATTFDLLTRTSPNGTRPLDDGNPATSDIQEVAAYLQAAINALQAQGVDKIVMLDQLDTLARNKELASLLTGVDIMVAGGGHERLGDSTDTAAAFNGHDANFIPTDTYPIVATGADGAPVLIVTTDTEYSYLGRLVVDFDANGKIIVGNLDPSVNGAYASTEAALQDAYNTTASADAIIDTSVIGSKVEAIVDAIDAIVAAKDGNIFGYTNVYLEGDRVFGRTEEVNLGSITADANLEAASEALPSQPFMISLKNGGGLRASIGSVAADGSKIPPLASDVKPAGGISQLDIENALRFDNKLMVFDTTPQGLLNILNYAASTSNGPADQDGGYPQIGGVRFSYDITNPLATRIESIALINDQGQVIARVVENGVVVADAPALISAVILNFTAQGGDGYPIKANGDNFRYLLNNGTLSAAVDEALDFTAVANVPANALGEQKALQDFLLENHATPATAYAVADTPTSGDTRIQILSARTDTVLNGPYNLLGTPGADIRTGSDLNDTITTFAGDDDIGGGAGNDRILAGEGNDKIDGGTGNDTIFGEGGNDRITGGDGNDFLLAGLGNDTVDGGSGTDTILGGDGADRISGGAGNDKLFGGNGSDRIDGGLGADTMYGGTGNDVYVIDNLGDRVVEGANGGKDTVYSSVNYKLGSTVERLVLFGDGDVSATGNKLANTIVGNSGDNIITGGLGRDVLKGGEGADTFRFLTLADSRSRSSDVISDFVSGTDKIDLSAIDSNLIFAGNQDFSFTGNTGLNGWRAQLSYVIYDNAGTASDRTVVMGDVNGDGASDLEIVLNGAIQLTASDFVL